MLLSFLSREIPIDMDPSTDQCCEKASPNFILALPLRIAADGSKPKIASFVFPSFSIVCADADMLISNAAITRFNSLIFFWQSYGCFSARSTDLKKDSSIISHFYGFYIFFIDIKIFFMHNKIYFNAEISKIILTLVSFYFMYDFYRC